MSDLTQGMHEVLTAFLIDRQSQNLAKSTIIFYREKLKYFTDFCKAQSIKTVSQITSNDLRLFFVSLQDNHSPGGMLNIYAGVRSFFRWIESEEIMPEGWKNPINKTRPPKVPTEVLDAISLEDVAKLLKVANIRNYCLVLVMLDTGARASELVALNIDDVDPLSGQVLIRCGKNRKPRYVYLGSKTRKALRAYLKQRADSTNPALWLTQGGDRLQYFGLREILLRMSKKANISPPPTLHSFRRAFAVSLLHQNVNLENIRVLLGHSSYGSLQRYLKQSNGDLRTVHKMYSPVDNGL
jgi:site-specific recombinase XerD